MLIYFFLNLVYVIIIIIILNHFVCILSIPSFIQKGQLWNKSPAIYFFIKFNIF